MRRFFMTFVFAVGFATPLLAADALVSHTTSVSAPAVRQLPFPRTERAASVWNERACWSQCGAYTAWAMADCLKHDVQGVCVERADHADRMCQRACRTSGGPYLPDIFDF
jgi:hypothetical protein